MFLWDPKKGGKVELEERTTKRSAFKITLMSFTVVIFFLHGNKEIIFRDGFLRKYSLSAEIYFPSFPFKCQARFMGKTFSNFY